MTGNNEERRNYEMDLSCVYPSLLHETRTLLNSQYLRVSSLSIKTYCRCYALPAKKCLTDEGDPCVGGGLCCDGKWVSNSGLNRHALKTYDFDSRDVDYVDGDVVFIGCMSMIYGHAITDGLKHLWWLLTEDYRKNHSWKHVYYWGEKSLSGNYLELLRLAGVDLEKLHYIDHIMQFRSVIVPDSSFVNDYSEGVYFYKEYVDTIDNIIAKSLTVTPPYQRLFFSQHSDRRNWNVVQIEKVAKAAGYKIVYPEEHTVQEQVSLLWSAKEVMTFESSIGHNIVFCHPNARVALLRKANYSNNYQMALNTVRRFDVSIIDVHLSVMNDQKYPDGGPFFVYANEMLCKYLNLNPFPFPWKAWKQYFRYGLYEENVSKLTNKLTISSDYAEILAKEINRAGESANKRLSKLFDFVPMPSKIKGRVVKKFHKFVVRHLV